MTDGIVKAATRLSPAVQNADGRAVEIVVVEAEGCSPVQIHSALRTLARAFVRQYRDKGDSGPNAGLQGPPSDLTVPRHPRTHHNDEAA